MIFEHLRLLIVLQGCFILLLLPLGEILLSHCFPALPRRHRKTLAFGVSILFWSAFLPLAALLRVPSELRTIFIWLISILSVVFWIRKGFAAELLDRRVIAIGSTILMYQSGLSLVSALPDGDFHRVSIPSLEAMMQLPSDNMIPFNFSRYFTSALLPQEMGDIVPGWSAGDRGPIGGIELPQVSWTRS